MAASHGMDIDRALEPIPEVLRDENFLSHPFLQACLFDRDGETVATMRTLVDQGGGTWRGSLGFMDDGTKTRLREVLREIRKGAPGLLPAKKSGDSTARILLGVTDNAGIPWAELDKATWLPHAQMPPLGTTPPRDDTEVPSTSMVPFETLLGFQGVASLRTHAALEAKKPDVAMQSLRIQSRIAEAQFYRSTLAGGLIGAGLTNYIVSQIHSGFSSRVWREEDIAWFAKWAAGVNVLNSIKQECAIEGIYIIRYLEGIIGDPALEDRLVRSFEDDSFLKEMASDAGLPFGQTWLRPFRGRSEALYRLVPRSVYVLAQADQIRDFCGATFVLLEKGGLREFAWPEKESRPPNKIIGYPQIGAAFAALQTRLNLVRTACALDRWRRARGAYPATLEELAPDLPAAAMEDVCTGKPLRYTKAGKDGYRLHSAGPDRVDDGRKPLVDQKGDIVWQ